MVSACITRAYRSSDFAARLGGDEFAILAPSTTASQAIELAQRLKAAVRAFPPEGPVPLSVSVGIADNTIARGEEVLLARADEALCSGKKRGRGGMALADAEAETVAA